MGTKRRRLTAGGKVKLPGTLAKERRMGTARGGEGEEWKWADETRQTEQLERHRVLLSPLFLVGTRNQQGLFGPSQPRGPAYSPDSTQADFITRAWPEEGAQEPACKERFMILFPGEVQTVSPVPGSDSNRKATPESASPRARLGRDPRE